MFHADDVLAAATLQLVCDQSTPGGYGPFTVIRTRDEEALASCSVIFDVGAKYSPAEGRFDHHQKERAGSRENGILYSSFGLVWKHFGAQLCSTAEGFHIVDRVLVQPVDATDNGQGLYTNEAFQGIQPYGVSDFLSSFNPCWGQPATEADFYRQFLLAMASARSLIQREISSAEAIVASRQAVRKAIASAEDPRLIILSQASPWQETVITESPQALFVMFPSETGDWRLQCVPDALGSFGKRRSLPAHWAGKRGQELAQLTDVSDAIFCHPGLFICGASSKEGVLRMAHLALQ